MTNPSKLRIPNSLDIPPNDPTTLTIPNSNKIVIKTRLLSLNYLQKSNNTARKTTSATIAAIRAILAATARLSSTPTGSNPKAATNPRTTLCQLSRRSDPELERNQFKWRALGKNPLTTPMDQSQKCRESGKKTKGSSS